MRLSNMMRMGIGAIDYRVRGVRRPLDIMMSLTNRCQSQCNYCQISTRSHDELNTQEVFKLLEQIRAAGAQRVGFWGGEPLVRDDIGRIVAHAKQLGFYVTLDTNGYWVPRKLDEIRSLDHLVISLDGAEASHDMNREKGSYQKALTAIETAAGKIPLWTITVLTRHNLQDIDFILNLAVKYRFQCTFQVIHHNDVLGRDMDPFLPDEAAYRQAFRKLLDAKRRGAPIASSRRYLEYALDWPDYHTITMKEPRHNLRCYAGSLYCNVDADGMLYPCSLLIGKIPGSDARALGFAKAFGQLKPIPCQACVASCFIEHNLLYSVNVSTIIDRIRSIR